MQEGATKRIRIEHTSSGLIDVIRHEMNQVPELYNLPPGVLPICTAYLGKVGDLVKRVDLYSSTTTTMTRSLSSVASGANNSLYILDNRRYEVAVYDCMGAITRTWPCLDLYDARTTHGDPSGIVVGLHSGYSWNQTVECIAETGVLSMFSPGVVAEIHGYLADEIIMIWKSIRVCFYRDDGKFLTSENVADTISSCCFLPHSNETRFIINLWKDTGESYGYGYICARDTVPIPATRMLAAYQPFGRQSNRGTTVRGTNGVLHWINADGRSVDGTDERKMDGFVLASSIAIGNRNRLYVYDMKVVHVIHGNLREKFNVEHEPGTMSAAVSDAYYRIAPSNRIVLMSNGELCVADPNSRTLRFYATIDSIST
jgi:hypothetical protein